MASEQIIAAYTHELKLMLERMEEDGVYITGSNFSLPHQFVVESQVNPGTAPGVWNRHYLTQKTSKWEVDGA